MSRNKKVDLIKVREALALYIASEGCSCCQSTETHEEAAKQLAELLEVPEYSDGSGYDFAMFENEGSNNE